MHKFKVGDLVRRIGSCLYSVYGIGIIVGPKQTFVGKTKQTKLGPAYDVYWTKKGLCWHYEIDLVGVVYNFLPDDEERNNV